MRTQVFRTDLWHKDVRALSPIQQKVATDILIFASLELGCHPYHRESKRDKPSDRQTIFKHPETGINCFVLSIVGSDGKPPTDVLRVDFFDKYEEVKVSFAKVKRAPKTQWTKKFERRFLVPFKASIYDLRQVIEKVVEVRRKRP
jgi:hypothetical protein